MCNEGTLRDWVRHAKFNVTQGKNWDQTGAIGPPRYLVPGDVLRRTNAAGKAAGILCLDDRAPEYVEAGARFVGVAIDVVTMMRAARETAQRWK